MNQMALEMPDYKYAYILLIENYEKKKKYGGPGIYRAEKTLKIYSIKNHII